MAGYGTVSGDALAHLGIPPLLYADGPNGVRDTHGVTAFPATMALATGRLEEIVDELQGVSERIRELGDECRANADVTVSPPTSSPTD